MKEKKEANVEVQHTSKPCGFCGCLPGDEAQWEAAADAAEMVFQQHYERLVLDRLLDLVRALEQDLLDARCQGWSEESMQRARGSGGDA